MVLFRSYGFVKFYLSDTLAGYVRRFYNDVRPWLFKDKANAPTTGSYLFVNQYGERLQSIGAYFKAAMKKYFNQEITIGIIRKVMETAVSECSLFNTAIRDNLSMAMLHDPETARRYYVCKDGEEASKTINGQWQQLRQFYSTPSLTTPAVEQVVEPEAIEVPMQIEQPISPIPSNNNMHTDQSPIATSTLELVPTGSLSQRFSWVSPTKQLSAVPSLVASPSHDDNRVRVRVRDQVTRSRAVDLAFARDLNRNCCR